MGTHVYAMFKSNLLGNFVGRLIHQGTKACAFHLKIRSKFFFKEILTRRAATHVPSANNKYILHTSIK